jgi:hypothetical protein
MLLHHGPFDIDALPGSLKSLSIASKRSTVLWWMLMLVDSSGTSVGSDTSSPHHPQLTKPGGHAAFQAIMHVLSELRNPHFHTPHRARALRAIQLSKQLKENNNTKPWQAVKSMIDKVISQNLYSADESVEDTSTQGSVPGACRTPPPSTSRLNPPAPAPVAAFSEQPLVVEPEAQPLAPLPQEPLQFNWDDLNFNNIVSGGQGPTELPEFDFVSWTAQEARVIADWV